jgi:hypothetical protein
MLQLFFPFFACWDVIGALGFTPVNKLPPNNDASLGKVDLFAELNHPVPARAFHGGGDEPGTDIALAEVFLVRADFVQPLICAIPKKNRAAFLCALCSNPGRKQRVQEEITAFIAIEDIP